MNFFKSEGINPGLFLVANIRNVNRAEMNSRKKLLTISELKILRKNGWIIGVHGATHSNLTKVSSYQLKVETHGAKKTLEKNLDMKMDYFAFPFGAYNKAALREIKKSGYKLAFTMDDHLFNKKMNNFELPRIGVNNTHSIGEFRTIYSPSVIAFRRLIKKLLN
jgi:peptidoglycan/xylan/chitin deacetylase (PgdA/CDA1 family)